MKPRKIDYFDILNEQALTISVINQSYSSKVIAWLVHTFTASGIVVALLALLATERQDWRMAMFWLVIALAIDGIDGFFARLFKVEQNLPFIQGKNIDYVVDFVNYAFIPAYMFFKAELVEDIWLFPLSTAILLVSALYYGRASMVSDDKYFLGFPVLWNMVLFYYLFISNFESVHYVWITVLICILHFVPIKMAYPSQNDRNKFLTISVFALFVLVILAAIYYYPSKPGWIPITAYLILGYFIVLTILDTFFNPTGKENSSSGQQFSQ